MIDENYAFAKPQICLRPRVTLTFDLLTPKVDRLMPLLCGPFVPICTRIGSFSFYRAMLCKRGMCHHAMSVCVCVCLSCSYILSKRVLISSDFFHLRVATPFWLFHTKYHGNIQMRSSLTGSSNARGYKKS